MRAKNKTTTSISVRGDSIYVKAVKAFAYSQGVDMADIVRLAIDKQFGHDLKPHLDFFCAQGESKNSQSGTKTLSSRSTKS